MKDFSPVSSSCQWRGSWDRSTSSAVQKVTCARQCHGKKIGSAAERACGAHRALGKYKEPAASHAVHLCIPLRRLALHRSPNLCKHTSAFLYSFHTLSARTGNMQ